MPVPREIRAPPVSFNRPLMRLIFVAAIVKVLTGIAVAPWAAIAAPQRLALPAWYYIALLLIFGGSGGLLYLGGKNDGRARLLGVVFVLFGTLFTDRLVASALPSLGDRLDGPRPFWRAFNSLRSNRCWSGALPGRFRGSSRAWCRPGCRRSSGAWP